MVVVYRVPMKCGDRWMHGPAPNNLWTAQMLYAQEIGKPSVLSGEWSDAQRYYKAKHPEHEKRFAVLPAWTGTVLDYTDGKLKERIRLNPDGSFAEVGVVLGEEDGIYLPEESGPIGKLHDKYMPLIARLHRVKDPRKELPVEAYFVVNPTDIRHVVRGGWGWRGRGGGRVAAGCAPADRWFAAWFVDDKPPENAITPAEYETRLAGIKRMQHELSAATVLME